MYEKDRSEKKWLKFLPILKKRRKKILAEADGHPNNTDYVVKNIQSKQRLFLLLQLSRSFKVLEYFHP